MDRRRFLATSGAAALGAGLSPRLRPARAAAAAPRTILLHSQWQTTNIGDIGHTPGTLRILEDHLPEAHVILLAATLDDRIRDLLTRRFPKLEIIRGSFKNGEITTQALKDAYRRADLCIKNSGMGEDTSFLAFARKSGKPYGLYGQSYFPRFVEGPEGPAHVDLLDGASFVYCRDSRTLATLKKAGVKSPVLEFAPDGCFGIDVRDDARAADLMRRKGLEDRKFITIQLRTNTPKSNGTDSPGNPLHPTPEQVADDERRAAKLRALITAWVEKTGNKVLIAPEVDKEMAHNKRLLHDPLPEPIRDKVANCDAFWNADEAASVFARAHTCVCHEPHSLIIALANGTPIIHTFSEFHSPKCWMFEDVGLGEWLLEIDETPVETMVETLLAIDADQPAARAKVAKAMDFVHRRQADTMKVVGSL